MELRLYERRNAEPQNAKRSIFGGGGGGFPRVKKCRNQALTGSIFWYCTGGRSAVVKVLLRFCLPMVIPKTAQHSVGMTGLCVCTE